MILTTVALAAISPAWCDLIDFETFSNGDTITNQISGVVFTNTMVLSAGIGINEFEFPPKSGANLAFDDGGPITIEFSTAVLSVGAFFTYVIPITLQAYDAFGTPLPAVQSLFSSNDALFGEAGSSPNEYLSLTNADGISRITITGDPSGGSLVLDDLIFTPSEPISVTPEPSSMILVGTVTGFMAWRWRWRFNKHHAAR
jgi:hypothetical protein